MNAHYQEVVGPAQIRTVTSPTFVLWGEEDDVLPVEDLYKYEQDLPNCEGIQLVPNAQHAPALENPEFVAQQIIDYTMKTAAKRKQPQAA